MKLAPLRRALLGRVEPKATFSVVVTAMFFVALTFVQAHHEFWRDEMHCWSVGKNAGGLWDLLTGDRRYDGHPFLWYYLLYLGSKLGRGAFGLHAITVLLETGACFLWLRHSRFPRFLRVMFVGSYLFFYEYGVMSRSYTLGVLLAFLFATVFRADGVQFVLPAMLLALLAMTSAYGTMWSVALALILFTHGWRQAGVESPIGAWRVPRSWLVGLAVWSAGIALTVATTLPPADAFFDSPARTTFTLGDFEGIGGRIWAALLPFGAWKPNVWPAYGWLGDTIPAIRPWVPRFGIAIAVVAAIAIARTWRTAIAFLLGMFMMGLFQHAKYPGGMRHWGHFFIFLVLCVWIANRQNPRSRLLWVGYVMLTGIFAIQLVTGVRTAAADVTKSFSGAEETAAFIKSHGWQDDLLVGSQDHAASAVAGYLDRPFLSAQNDEYARSVTFHNRRHFGGVADALAMVPRRLASMGKTAAVLILNADPGAPLPPLPGFRVTAVYNTEVPVVGDEQFWLLRVTPQ